MVCGPVLSSCRSLAVLRQFIMVLCVLSRSSLWLFAVLTIVANILALDGFHVKLPTAAPLVRLHFSR